MSQARAFDQRHYESYNTSRARVVGGVLSQVKDELGLRTAVDVGCGFGYFSAFLCSLGFEVTAVDGRSENIEEAERRVPGVRFRTMNVEDSALQNLGRFDLTLCFGLLYHLENPFLAIRNLRAITSRLLFVESIILPGSEPIMGLVDEGRAEDQALNYVAFYPTESCLVKMLYQVGFPHVYRFISMPDHPDFRATRLKRRVRTMLVASDLALKTAVVEKLDQPMISIQPWDGKSGREAPLLAKLQRFTAKPMREKVKTVKRFLRGR